MKPPSRLRYLRLRLEYVAVRAIIGLAGLLPLRLAVGWSATLWRILAPRINPKRHRMALENLRIAFPEKGGSERLAICLAHWENLGRVIVETVQIDRVLADPSCIDIPDQHLLARYGAKLGPAIGVSLHMGNWELAIWPLLVAGANPAALYRAIDNPYVDEYLRAKRQALYPAGLIGRRRTDADPLDDLRTAHRLMHHVRGASSCIKNIEHVTGLGATKRSRDQSLTAPRQIRALAVPACSCGHGPLARPELPPLVRYGQLNGARPGEQRSSRCRNAPKMRMLLQPVNKARPFSNFVRSGSIFRVASIR